MLPETGSVEPTESKTKRILYYAPTDLQFRRWMADIQRVSACHVLDERYPPLLRYKTLQMSWVAESTPEGAIDRLHQEYAHVLVLDLRWAPEPDDMEEGIKQARRLLFMLDQVEDLETRYGFHRILAMVYCPRQVRTDQLMVELGGAGIRHVLRQHSNNLNEPPTEEEAVLFAERTLQYIQQLLEAPRRRRTALCLAGGGITGIYYELGALKCLDDCLSSPQDILPRINDFDMYFGISAGAINAGVLTAGYAIEEFMAAIANIPGGRIAPVDLSLLRIKHFNVRGFVKRLFFALEHSWNHLKHSFQEDRRINWDSLLMAYGESIGAPFHSYQFEKLLREFLTLPGTTNQFKKLPRELYIGATEHDLKKHVLFGSEGYEHIPISKAIQASLSIHPAFSSVRIEGKYYEDGAVTKTNHYAESVRRGASLVFVFDPFLPYVAQDQDPGYTQKRGLLYNIDQDIRTISYTRYENERNWVLRKHPDVSSYTFVPSNRLRHLLSSNPMDHRPYLEIWKGAYLSTFRRIQYIFYRLQGDLEAHGLHMELDKAQEIRNRLNRTQKVEFQDFFPDGRIEIRQPPFALHQTRQTPKETSLLDL